ncbi:RNA polymerase sporulation sigma factor SigH [Christensenella minuta]|uniref:RNA polymerase sigma-H factor n=1 Tax=Christensenella minuta TaxID=626937 RepID=A0A136Q5K8_9FIRM|nr:RNA polymerase sporulation sigma factor SigH [Christensenella minuta]AYH40078.1 RNA polymerase sporulation sigma factor SigH [Christensenella minuta]KXK65874.1 RNA polymerase sigma-H factor [Christensenella minuta]
MRSGGRNWSGKKGKKLAEEERRGLPEKLELEEEREVIVHAGFEKYALMTDEQIVIMANEEEGSPALEYILHKYKNFVRAKARSYFLIGADKEDIVQEGMIGLYKAVRDYDAEKKASFRAFAELCVTRQIITAIKTATRQKHQPLNSYVSLNKPVYDEESERTLVDIIAASKVSNPEEIVIDQEDYASMEEEISKMLSSLENQVLTYYLHGLSYQQIAKIMGRHEKSIDNALQRAKGKIDKFLEAKNGVRE